MVFGVFRVFFLVFGIHFSLFHETFSPSPPLRVVWRCLSLTIYPCPLGLALFFSFFFRHTLSASLPRRSEVWEWVLRSRIFDSCSSSWNRGFHEFPIILLIRFIRVGRQCYATALNEAENPVITWVQVLG